MDFKLKSSFDPGGDQPQAIKELTEGLRNGEKDQVLLGVTGSGKTFTMANVIQNIGKPTLIISHNKTLAAQLFEEFKSFFPENAVEYFVSFYDFYQPEAYLPSSDTYIEKTAEINDEIDRLRLKATASLLSRKDVIIVASVSCIYNIGSPDNYQKHSYPIAIGDCIEQEDLLHQLVKMQYIRNDIAFERGTFRVRGDTVDIFPAYEESALRLEFYGDEIDRISIFSPVTGKIHYTLDETTLFPAKHYVSSNVPIENAIAEIEAEMESQVEIFESEGKLIEAQRIRERTRHDMEMLQEVGYINGIENYSRILDGRAADERPFSLIDFFPDDFLTIIDESHITVPQIGGMFNGDRARKTTLVNHGFRIPSALDNRPLRFEEFAGLLSSTIYLSATPSDYELELTNGAFVEQVIRPTGLIDPPIEILPATTQVDDLIKQLRPVVDNNERALVTTLTKKSAEDLTDHLEKLNYRVRYLHSEIDTLQRPIILAEFRRGEFDILIGINLLREGLDLPEVSLVAILDADREGFLRSTRSLIQIAGRAARNVNGKVIFYAEKETKSIKATLEETARRRKKQIAHNEKHNITPKSTTRNIGESFSTYSESSPSYAEAAEKKAGYSVDFSPNSQEEKASIIYRLKQEMGEAAAELHFEKAAQLRDKIEELQSS